MPGPRSNPASIPTARNVRSFWNATRRQVRGEIRAAQRNAAAAARREARANTPAGRGRARAEARREAQRKRREEKEDKKKDKKEEKEPGRAHVNLWGKNRPERAKGVFSTPKSERSGSKERSNTFFVGIGGSSLREHFGFGKIEDSEGKVGVAIDIERQFGFGRRQGGLGLDIPTLFGNSPAGKARQSRGIEARRG